MVNDILILILVSKQGIMSYGSSLKITCKLLAKLALVYQLADTTFKEGSDQEKISVTNAHFSSDIPQYYSKIYILSGWAGVGNS